MLERLRAQIATAIRPPPAPGSKEDLQSKGVVFGTDFFGPTSGSLIYLNGKGPGPAPTMTEDTAYAIAALAYAAVNYRARNIAEAPPRVARELDDGTHEWVDHPLDSLLTEPSPDYDMWETVWLTMASLDLFGASLWKLDENRGGATGAIMPFTGREFDAEPADGRIYGRFQLDTRRGRDAVPWEEVVHFHNLNPTHRYQRSSPTRSALRWLNVGSEVEQAVTSHMANGMFPSVILSAHQDWDPDPETYKEYVAKLTAFHAGPANTGKPFVALGGSKVERPAFSLKDLLPDEMLDRIEASVSMAFGISPVVLGALVGLKNSPWSQMAEARRMTYEDTLVPLWEMLERVLTRQLLRPMDPRPELVIKFDTSGIVALQEDQSARIDDAREATHWTLDERRTHSGQEPLGGEDGEWIEARDGGGGGGPVPPGLEEDDEDGEKWIHRPLQLKGLDSLDLKWWRFSLLTKAQHGTWEGMAHEQLRADARAYRGATESDAFGDKWAGALRALGTEKAAADHVPGLIGFLTESVQREDAWKAAAEPLAAATAGAALRDLADDLGLDFGLISEGLPELAAAEAGRLAKDLTPTTLDRLATVMEEGLTAGDSIAELGKRLESSAGFSQGRANLIAQTETTSLTNRAQRESMSRYQADNVGVAVVEKAWLSSRNESVRAAHDALDKRGAEEGWLPVDSEYDNGLQGPSEPNCHCTQVYRITEGT